jgi:hypothetical protein
LLECFPVRQARTEIFDEGGVPPLLASHSIVGTSVNERSMVNKAGKHLGHGAFPDLHLNIGQAKSQ